MKQTTYLVNTGTDEQCLPEALPDTGSSAQRISLHLKWEALLSVPRGHEVGKGMEYMGLKGGSSG